MKVKLLQSRAGVDFSQNAGDIVEVSASEAERMIAAGQAVPAQDTKKETKNKKMTGVEKRA